MKTSRLIAGLIAVGLLATACGDDTKEPAAGDTVAPGATTAPAAQRLQAGEGRRAQRRHQLAGPELLGHHRAEVDPDKISSGIEFDMANMIAAWCGLKMEFRNEGFDAIVAGQIDPTSYDIVLSQVTITEDRAKVVDFSVGYFKSDQGLLVNKGTAVASWDDMKKLTVGVQASTTAEFYVTSGEVPGWKLDNVKSFPDLASAYAALTPDRSTAS